jgi:D-alanine-D-alanine ligase
VPVLSGCAIGCIKIELGEGDHIYSEQIKYGDHAYKIFDENDEVRKTVFLWAEKMHTALGCSGITRSDFRYNPNIPDNRGVYYLETNTQPGLSKISLIPTMLEMQNNKFQDILKIMIDDAIYGNKE